MITEMKKYLFFGLRGDLDHFFERAQQQGVLEFISLSKKKAIELSPEVQSLTSALKLLRKQPVKKQIEKRYEREEALEVAHRILDLKADLEKLQGDHRLLEMEIARVGPFGDFSKEDIDYIEREGRRQVQFFCMKTNKSRFVAFGEEVIPIATEYDLDYFLAISPSPPSYPDAIHMRIDRPVSELKNELGFVKESEHHLEAELKGFASYIDFLHTALLEELSDHELRTVKKEASFPMENSFFAIEAWLPANKLHALDVLLDSLRVSCEPIAIEETDRIPTCMQNKAMNRVGEDLVGIYDIPAHTDRDPSGWVIWSFVLFFAMIISDGGYGLIYLAIAAYLRHKFPYLKGLGKRVWKLCVVLALACVVWGLLTSSFFGLPKDSQGPFSKISLVDALVAKKELYHAKQEDAVHAKWHAPQPGSAPSAQMADEFADNILLEFSLLAGIIHISISLLRYVGRNWAAFGWVAFMWGGYLFFPSLLDATTLIHILGDISKKAASEVGLQLLVGGIVWASAAALFQRGWRGIAEIFNLVQVFADVLSYLRLYALGLAGAMMATTFNDMGMAVGFVAGGLIVLCGHTVNIVLSTMGGVIHGLRLNFLEWYHYSFEGGGRLFRPLKRLNLLTGAK